MYNVLDLLNNSGISPRKVAIGKHGEEYHSSCPVCGDGSPRDSSKGASDRFQTWPNRSAGGYYTCRQCGIHGDNIQFLRDTEGKTYPEACHALGITMTGGVARPAVATPKPPQARKQEFSPHAYAMPPQAWLEHAQEFVNSCHEQLMGSPAALKWLADRGITEASCRTYRLGYNPGNNGGPLYKSRQAWGLPEEAKAAGKAKPLWLPVGLVIPLLDDQGQVIQARIRRKDADRAAFLPELKYYVIPGGCQATMVLNPTASCLVTVEAGLDAILVAQEGAALDTGALTTWNSTAKPDATTAALLAGKLKILVALDADAPGDKASAWWLATYRNAKRHRPTGGKDPGEMFAAGSSIRAWLLSGLPPAITLFADDDQAPPRQHPAQNGDLVTKDFGLVAEGEGQDLRAVAEGGTAQVGDVAGLQKYMQQYRVTIYKDADGLQIRNLGHCPDAAARIVQDLVWMSDSVGALIDRHPAHLITAANLLGA